MVKGARKQLNDLGYKGELMFNEWGRSWFPADDIRETPNEAAFIAMTLANCSQYADHMAYWCLSDIYDQAGYGLEAFYGGYGLMSLDGLKKPSYKAFQLLTKLGDKQVTVNTKNANIVRNGIATKNADGYQFLFYGFEKEYIVDEVAKKQTISVLLPKGTIASKIEIYQIGSTENNILTEWKKMNKPSYPNKIQLSELYVHNALEKYTGPQKLEKTNLGIVLTFETEATGVAFVNIQK